MDKQNTYKIISWAAPFLLIILLFLKIEVLAFMLPIALTVAVFYISLLYSNLRNGSVLLLFITYFLIAISRYTYHFLGIIFPFGFIVDGTILVMFILYFIKQKGKYEWFRLNNQLVALWTVWFIYTLLQALNPDLLSKTIFYMSFRSVSYYVLAVIMLTFLVFYRYKDFKFVTILWSILACLAALKGIGQLAIGLDGAEHAFVYDPNNKTHMLFGQLRVFSFMSDAGTFGASQAQNAVIGLILFLELKNTKERYLHLITFILTITGMAISGTRGALFVIFIGGIIYVVLKGKSTWFLAGALFITLAFSFLKYTTILQSNSHIRRMRTALDPEDASLQVRLINQRKLSVYMEDHPFGYGLGSIGVTASVLMPHSQLAQIPTDSWYVRIWVETGIVGLIFYIAMLVWIMLKSALMLRKVENLELKSRLIAVHASICGIIVASYGNEIFGQHPICIFTYTCLAFLFLSTQMDKELKSKKIA